TLTDRESPAAIVGVRTAGAYMAPLIGAALAAEGFARPSRMSIRPTLGLSGPEAQDLGRLATGRPRGIGGADYQNTGHTRRRTLDLLQRRGVRLDRVTVAVPRHPARLDWQLPAGAEAARLVVLEPGELHKARLLEPAAMEALLREYAPAGALHVEET